jgi:hypothetical protein
MTKRQLRLYTQDIPSGIEKALNLPLSIVMKTGEVYLFKILEMNNGYLEVEDMRKLRQKIQISDIEEIIIEGPQ